MRAFADGGDVVFEPFFGSGTSVIAGERTGRRVRAIEWAPEYVDVSLLRWRQSFPDKPLTLAGDGRTFDDVAAERARRAA